MSNTGDAHSATDAAYASEMDPNTVTIATSASVAFTKLMDDNYANNSIAMDAIRNSNGMIHKGQQATANRAIMKIRTIVSDAEDVMRGVVREAMEQEKLKANDIKDRLAAIKEERDAYEEKAHADAQVVREQIKKQQAALNAGNVLVAMKYSEHVRLHVSFHRVYGRTRVHVPVRIIHFIRVRSYVNMCLRVYVCCVYVWQRKHLQLM